MLRRFLLLGVQALGLAVLVSLLIRVLFGRSTRTASTPLALASAGLSDATRNAGNDPLSTSSVAMAAPLLSSQNPWRANEDRQRQNDGNAMASGGDERIFDRDNGNDANDENENEQEDEAYMPVHLSALLVRDGVPKHAPGPQSF